MKQRHVGDSARPTEKPAKKKYATCGECGTEMVPGGGCAKHFYIYGGKKYLAQKADEQCHDCNAGPGKFHHANCDWERCPVCGGQAMGCEHCIQVEVHKKVPA